MAESLDRLSELVRQAEAKSRAQRINVEIDTAVHQLRTAEERTRKAEQRLREVRPVRIREIEKADVDEQQLKELVKRLAQFKSQLSPDHNAEELIAASQKEIEIKRREAIEELEDTTRESEDARSELRVAIDQYQQLRRDLDRLQPQLVPKLAAEDKLAAEAELYFPSGQLQALSEEVDAGIEHFADLDPKEQYAQLKIWIGRYRRLQTNTLTDNDQILSRRIFGKLVGLSKEYEPGYIEAFQINFSTDWDAFVAEAQEQLQQATEAARRKREMEHQQEGFYSREHERHRHSRESAQEALEELKSVVLRFNLPEEGTDEFRSSLSRVVSACGASDSELLEMVMPFRDLIEGWNEFRTLRRNLDRLKNAEGKDGPRSSFDDLLSLTRGKRVLLIGGVARDDVRKSLQHIFDFENLEWETFEDSKPNQIDSYEEKVKGHEVDLVLILKSLIRHSVAERLKGVCEQGGTPCLIVEHGYGPVQLADTLRRGLLKV